MRASDVKKLDVIKTEGLFTPIYSYLETIPILDEGVLTDYEYTDFILYKTAEEVYQEYLNPPPPQLTVEDFNLEMDYRVTILEMIGGI